MSLIPIQWPREPGGILLDLADDLKGMGYQEEWVERVITSSMTGYMRMLSKMVVEGKPRNRKGADTLKNRRFKKILGL